MLNKVAFAVMFLLPLLHGCGTYEKYVQKLSSPTADAQQPQAQSTPSAQSVPNAQLTVRQFVAAHTDVMEGMAAIKSGNQAIQTDVDAIKTSNQKALDTAQRTLQAFEDMAAQQGTGEISIFFQNGSSKLEKSTLDYERLVHFADFLARESRGRKVILLSIGRASAYGDNKANTALAKKRSEVPLDILNKYLINTPHEFHKVFGTGDLNSPKDVRMKEHQRYQHTRIIAVFGKEKAASISAALEK